MYWLAKSRTDLCIETGITLDQYKRIMPELQRLGLVVTELGLFQGKVTPHIRLSNRGARHMKECYPKWAGAPNHLEAKHTYPLVENGTTQEGDNPPNTTETTTSDCTESTTSASAEYQQHQNTAQENPMNAQEILAKQKNKAPITALGLWKKRMATIFPHFQNLTVKQEAQLRQAMKHLPPESAMAMLDWALQHWQKFTLRVKADNGTAGMPEIPNPGYVLQHWQSLIVAYDQQHKPKPVQSCNQLHDLPPPLPKIVDNPAVHTESEIQELFAYFQKGGPG